MTCITCVMFLLALLYLLYILGQSDPPDRNNAGGGYYTSTH